MNGVFVVPPSGGIRLEPNIAQARLETEYLRATTSRRLQQNTGCISRYQLNTEALRAQRSIQLPIFSVNFVPLCFQLASATRK